LAGKLTPENHEAVLARAVHKTRDQVEVLLRELDPLPDLRSSVRKVAAASQGSINLPPSEGEGPVDSAPPVPRPVVRPSAPQRYHVKFTIGEETHRNLRRVQTLLRREIPDGDPGAIFDRALVLLLEKVERKKLGATARPRRRPSIRPGTDNPGDRRSRHIPNEVKRVVSKRDAGQCAFVSPDGRRCTQRAFLEFHHIQPFEKQGPATVENISLRCRAHNVYESELVFGPFDPFMIREAPGKYAALGEVTSVSERVGGRSMPPRRSGARLDRSSARYPSLSGWGWRQRSPDRGY
jgi:hypothetical protein